MARRRNTSYRKTKKAVKKAQREGLLEAGPMFQKWSKRKNPRVTMPLKSLRRLVSAAIKGQRTSVKARLR